MEARPCTFSSVVRRRWFLVVLTSWTNSVAVGVKTDGGLEVLGIFEDGVEG